MFAWSGLRSVPHLRDFHSRRVSSYDPTGGNRDWRDVAGGQSLTLAEMDGPGCIRHIWMTMLFEQEDYLRRVLLHFHWDGLAEPSVECPIGDFFGLGHARRKNFVSAPLQMSPQDGRGFNCWWPMPFRRSARIEVVNQGTAKFPIYFYVDYEAYDSPAALDGMGYFHVQWRRENPTCGWGDEHKALWAADRKAWMEKTWHGGDPRSLNQTGRDNYVILDATGNGVYCGAHLDVDVFERQANDWYGEGDDMIFIDGEAWPPSLHGTGTEDWHNCAFGPSQEYQAPYHGVLLYSGTAAWPWRGKQSVYRYHILDPIRFRRSIRATIEHGHANKLANDYSSTAYYYLEAPQRGGPPILPVEQRLPRPDEPTYA